MIHWSWLVTAVVISLNIGWLLCRATDAARDDRKAKEERAKAFRAEDWKVTPIVPSPRTNVETDERVLPPV